MPNTNPKLPKRKKSSGLGLGRKKKGGNKKRSSYNYDAARTSMAMPSANHAQISQFAAAAGPNPPTQKSPLKSEYKAMLKSKVEEFESVVKEKEEVLTQNNELKSVLNSKDKKISAQQAKIHDLSLLLQTEKKKSRSVISKLMSDADAVIAEAHDISFEADQKVASVSQTLDRIQQKHRVSLMKERQHNSSQVAAREFVPYYLILLYSNLRY